MNKLVNHEFQGKCGGRVWPRRADYLARIRQEAAEFHGPLTKKAYASISEEMAEASFELPSRADFENLLCALREGAIRKDRAVG